MASSPLARQLSSISLLLRSQTKYPPCQVTKEQRRRRRRRLQRRTHQCILATQTQGSNNGPRAPPGVDTRIHWENEDEGWIGGTKSKPTQEQVRVEEQTLLSQKFSDLINNSTDSHYQFLGVSAESDLEEIKAAYRKLSKEYHPDTTTLPLKVASQKFMKLKEVYDVLSDAEKRRFYDWTLAQEAASREVERMRMKLEDPYMKDIENYVPVPDMVDRLDGRNMELSGQAKSALTFDVVVIVFSICCIIYVVFFKQPYY